MSEIDFEEHKDFEERMERRILSTGLPREYLKFSLFENQENKPFYNIKDSSNEINESKQSALRTTFDYIKAIDENYKNGTSLFYFGPPNKKLGISLLGTYIIRFAVEKKYKAKFVHFPTLCEDLGYGVDDIDKEDYYESDFLMIDSISSKSQSSSKIIDGFADIILYRRKNNLPTIFSSYITPEELASRHSEALISYLDDFVIRVELKHGDAYDGKTYEIDKYISYLKEKRRDKKEYNYSELRALIDKFVNNYHFL